MIKRRPKKQSQSPVVNNKIYLTEKNGFSSPSYATPISSDQYHRRYCTLYTHTLTTSIHTLTYIDIHIYT